MKRSFITRSFRVKTRKLIAQIDEIVQEYRKQGYIVSVRQVYYQLVARDLIGNSLKSYKLVQRTITDGRNAGLIDWDAFEDRGRVFHRAHVHGSPEDEVRGLASRYSTNHWAGHERRPEVWVEKDALLGVDEPACRGLQVGYISCRGYASITAKFDAGHARGRGLVVLHLGDHDPSGIDATRDLREWLSRYAGEDVPVVRVALNLDQVRKYKPPPNYAKETDARYRDYAVKYGSKCWELDALRPDVLSDLIREAVLGYRDDALYEAAVREQEAVRSRLRKLAEEL